MKRTVVLLSIILMVLTVSVTAQSISTQGVLRDSDGHSVEDGDYAMNFTIYDALDGGALLWGPFSKTVAVENGVYQVVLGDEHPITSFNSDGGNYLEITVENETMTPRLRLNVTPYELANLSGASNVFPGSGNVGVGTTSPQSKLAIVAPGDNVDLIQLDEDSDDTKEFSFQGMFAGTGSSGNGLKLRSQWIDKIMFWRGDGRVGIGTTTPQQKLHVEGSIYATEYIGNKGVNKGQQMENGDEELTTLRFDSDNYRIYAGGAGGRGQIVTINESGKMGLGTSTPDTKLQIRGGTDVAVSGGGYIQLGSSGGTNVAIDDNEIMARNNGATATLSINNNGGATVIGGNLDLKDDVQVHHSDGYRKPFQFRKYSGSGENLYITTSYSADEWIAAITGIDAGYGDIDENGSMDLWQFNCFVEDGVWKIFCDAPTHNNGPDWDVYVMFVSTQFGYASAGYKSN